MAKPWSVAEVQRDYERVKQCDPYYDREIELKFEIAEDADPFGLVDDLEQRLKNEEFLPYRFDSFGYFRDQTNYLFAAAPEAGGDEVCTIVNLAALWAIRMKRNLVAVPAGGTGLRTFILDRQETWQLPAAGTIDALLGVMESERAQRRCPIQYLGPLKRQSRTIACTSETGHRYAIATDRSVRSDGQRPLQQLEIEYIWKREPTPTFPKDEIYGDLERLGERLLAAYNKGRRSLTPTRLTKFEWFTSPLES